METKTQKIVAYMMSHTGITQMDAIGLCKALRLSAIVYDLKQRGYEIKTIMHQDGRTRYAEYQLTPKYKKYLEKVRDEGK